jgi:hypothetical protein
MLSHSPLGAILCICQQTSFGFSDPAHVCLGKQGSRAGRMITFCSLFFAMKTGKTDPMCLTRD